MAITIDGVSFAGASPDSATSVTVTAPGGTGGNLIAITSYDQSYTGGAPAGWANPYNVTGTVLKMSVFTFPDDAAGSYVFTSGTFGGMSAVVVRLGGASLAGLVFNNTINTGNVTHFTSGSITTVAANSLALWFGCSYNHGGTWTTSGGQHESQDFAGGAASAMAQGLYDEIIASISTPTAPVLTRSGYSHMGGISLAISPAASDALFAQSCM